MPPASVSRRERETTVVSVLTDVENMFRNAKLRASTQVAYKAFADTASKGSFFVLTVVAARQLTQRSFGVLALGTTIGWMLSIAADFGVQMHLARAVAQVPAAAGALLRRWWRVRVLATSASLLVLAGGLIALGVDRETAVPLLAFAAAYACTGLVEFLHYFYRGLSRSDLESTLTLGQRTMTLVLGLGVLLWRPDVTWFAVAMLASAIVTLVRSARIATRLAAGNGTSAGNGADAPPASNASFRPVLPIGVGIVLSALYFRVDVLLVQYWAGSEAVAGYNAVFRVIDALRLFPAAVLAVALPALCRADSLDRITRLAGALTASAAIVAALLFTTADRIVPALFGAAYSTATDAFRVLALSFPLLSLNYALTHQLIGWNQERAYAIVCALALVANLALNAWLIPAWSIEGAAWATLGTELCVTGGCAVALWTRT